MDPIQLSSEKKGPGSDGQAPSPEKAKAIVDVSQDPTEKTSTYSDDAESPGIYILEGRPDATEDDLLEANELAASMSLESVHAIMTKVSAVHQSDPNFSFSTLQRIDEFLANTDVMENPDKHKVLVQEMKLEAAFITNNSPYAEVRAVVDNHDDPTIPASTIRAWSIGILFSIILAFINQLFSIRQPPIHFGTNIAQLLAFPLGKAWERWMPRREISVPFSGRSISLNPGRFTKKEHMLIAIMANTSKGAPFTNLIIWTQVLPQYFNQQYARNFFYIFLNGFATNFVGYGLAGITRKFLVYPAYCVWPVSLVTIALNSALHDEKNQSVLGPLGTTWSISRYRFFMYCFGAMFVYFWLPNYLVQVLMYFSWMTWISPNNRELNILTGMQNGLGLFNPLPTFDWNVVTFSTNPLIVPSFATFNAVGGMFVSGLFILVIWYSNVWNTGYLPINTNKIFDHFGKAYNVSATLDDRGMYDEQKHRQYSDPYIGASNALVYGCFFAVYSALVTHVIIYHRFEIKTGFQSLFKGLRFWKKKTDGNSEAVKDEHLDVHNRLMAAYPEVSEWWYAGTLVISVVFGVLGITLWPTFTPPTVILWGILLCLVFVIPIGIITSMTGIHVTLNVLAEFIGGTTFEGNALAMNFFKAYGYITTAHALSFAHDLKIAHYVKIPPRVTFAGQMLATLISTLVCSSLIKFQMNIEDVCSPKSPMHFTCPGANTFFTASVLWGTIGPVKVFGINGQYKWLLLGFPSGVLIVLGLWGLRKAWPSSRALRQVHAVALISGALHWAPYSFSYAFPAVPVAWFSWIYIRGRYLAFWSKYNFVLSAALSAGVGVSAIVIFFTVQLAGLEVNWWANTQPTQGCEGTPCLLKTLGEGERFFA
ncbi:Oligopeptide transporter OPT superfamily [Ophiocordyceps sinensis CO18]|uniref:Oligopeptide transporter OPT superfamily n=1 Tax=Ophiocordyceps sinensis (strain Co18 / CGMCC 3.14243) TaxID=911162 RepID=T5A7K0_OPHSC|nr:Oligopeptide transporter OPT superfamily [Ophiocordyceps sinensis CO18]